MAENDAEGRPPPRCPVRPPRAPSRIFGQHQVIAYIPPDREPSDGGDAERFQDLIAHEQSPPRPRHE